MIGDDGAQRVDLLAGKYFFNPDYIVVKVNVPVEIKMRKEPGIVPHNLAINEPEADIEVKESIGTEPKIIRFTPTKTGKYPFFCNKKLLFFKSHREKGMEGIIEVVP
jgi:plastocyanin